MTYEFDKIEEHYKALTPFIFQAAKDTPKRWITPYSNEIDWPGMFTPIEMSTWMAIRGFGQAPLYPQYPVGKYFVDFGNPVVKVAIECDGKEWHQHRAEQDHIRDTKLKELGWDVYRICGSDCVRLVEEYEEIMGNYILSPEDVPTCAQEYYQKTIEGLVRAIAFFYFGYKRVYDEMEYDMAHQCLVSRISIDDQNLNNKYNIFQNLKYKN